MSLVVFTRLPKVPLKVLLRRLLAAWPVVFTRSERVLPVVFKRATVELIRAPRRSVFVVPPVVGADKVLLVLLFAVEPRPPRTESRRPPREVLFEPPPVVELLVSAEPRSPERRPPVEFATPPRRPVELPEVELPSNPPNNPVLLSGVPINPSSRLPVVLLSVAPDPMLFVRLPITPVIFLELSCVPWPPSNAPRRLPAVELTSSAVEFIRAPIRSVLLVVGVESVSPTEPVLLFVVEPFPPRLPIPLPPVEFVTSPRTFNAKCECG